MSQQPTILSPQTRPGDAQGTAPCTGVFSLQATQALFALDCPSLGVKVLGQADGQFAVDSVDSNDGTLFYFSDPSALAGPLKCEILHKETLFSPLAKICVIIADEEKTVALFQGTNPPEQQFDALGTASVFKQG
ncbi:hypothetical protein F4779DRAFT_635836 [Xylariaceae sp. FL0662B]|nr:hypothetical protein F4779DRAFT_635836 [Xylariaceae sp. FL0662B]